MLSETTIAAIAITTGLIAQIILQVLAKLDANKLAAQQKSASDHAAIKVNEVKNALASQNDTVTRQLTNIHTLVNSNMATQLKLNLELSEWKVAQLKANPNVSPNELQSAIASAEQSRRMYEEHVKKQEIIDLDKKSNS